MGIVIFDDTPKKQVKDEIQRAYRDLRKRVTSSDGGRGRLGYLHDDLYFGDSAYSRGIQAADICCYLINRHLNQRVDTEELYQKLEPHIIHGKIEPEA